MTNEKAVGNIGYGVWGSGGGGSGGQYVFASLEELDTLKTEWTTVRDDISSDGIRLATARATIHEPAEDVMSKLQYVAVGESLDSAIEHNKTMFNYAKSYVEKLGAAIEQYAADDEANAARVRSADDE